MSALASWCHRYRLVTVLLWIGLIVGLGAVSGAVGTSYSSSLSLPATESSSAMNLLKSTMPDQSGDSDTVVWHVSSGSVDDPAAKGKMSAALDQIAHAPAVASVTSPYGPQGASQVSKDGATAYAKVNFADDAQHVAVADVKNVMSLADAARGPGLDVQLGGQAVENAERSFGGSTELIGVLAALVVMFLVFRSVLAALMPIVTALAGVATGIIGVGLLSHVMTMADTSTTLAMLIGLGVGIDYALFVVNRYRKGLMSGLSVHDAVVRAVNTSGRAVLFAGLTVIVALLGMFALGISFLNGMAAGAALTVGMTVLAAVTLLPALLSMMKLRVLSKKQRRLLADCAAKGDVPPPAPIGVWGRWAEKVQAKPTGKAVLAFAVMCVFALPVFSLRLGSSDAGNNPKTTTTRQAYDLLASGFGAGSNGPLLLVAQTPSAASQETLKTFEAQLRTLPGVSSVAAAPEQPGQAVGVISVVPASSPESKQTTDLIGTLRADVIPKATAGTDLKVLVGGSTAISADFADVLTSKLPLFIAIIVGLGCLLMMIAFRSVLVPLIGMAMNLLTMGAAFGVIVAVFQWGWGSEALGAGAAGPVEAFSPTLIIAILFGLSMDYQVFLISRMHEEWSHTGDNRRSVRVGHGETGLVITAAAVIMGSVFASFVFGGQRFIAEFGLGLSVAVLLDVLLLRMVLVPALMHKFGNANWWLPKWLDRVLPHVSVEGEPDPEPAGATVPAQGGRHRDYQDSVR